MKLTVATRGSALALWQTQWVIQQLQEQHGPGLEVDVLTVRTQGDKVLNVPIAQIGGKGIFVKEIEEALLSGAADFAVHSLKDMPAQQPAGLCIAAVPRREDPRDALVLPEGGVRCSVFGVRTDPSDPSDPSDPPEHPTPNTEHRTPNTEHLNILPRGASIGTTSRRRGALILHERPDLQIQMLRGNLDTRLHKLDIGQHDAIILAAAGLRRLGFAPRISQLLPVEHFVPCAGQGALAVEAREDDQRVRALLAALEHPPTRECVTAERTVLRRLGADCHTPLGAHAALTGDRLELYGMLASPDGVDLVRIVTHAPAGAPEAAGARLADLLIDAGGDRILAALGMRQEA
jgi:hydroxymethylbilane synthase